MAGYAPFPQVLVHNLQQVVITDLHRTGQYSSYAIQEMLLELLRDGDLNSEDGFFNDGFFVEGIAGSFDVKVRKGWGFQYDATGLSDKQSAYRVLHLPADLVLSTGGSPPGAGTYYVHAKYASADGQSENRQVRPIPGAAFATSAVNTAHLPAADVTWDVATPKAGYLLVAQVVVGAAPADSVAYTYTDGRQSLSIEQVDDSIPLTAAVSATANWTYAASVEIGSGSDHVWENSSGIGILEIEIPFQMRRGAAIADVNLVGFRAFLNGAGDTIQAGLVKRTPGTGEVDLTTTGVVTQSGAFANWIYFDIDPAVAAALALGDRIVLQINATAVAGLIEISGLFARRNKRYLGT